jgi:hypothetical protein
LSDNYTRKANYCIFFYTQTFASSDGIQMRLLWDYLPMNTMTMKMTYINPLAIRMKGLMVLNRRTQSRFIIVEAKTRMADSSVRALF